MAFIWKLKPWVNLYIKTGRNYIFKGTQIHSFRLSYSTTKYHGIWGLVCMLCLTYFFQWSTMHHCNFNDPNIRQFHFSSWNLDEKKVQLLITIYCSPGTELLQVQIYCAASLSQPYDSVQGTKTYKVQHRFPRDLEFLKTSAGQSKAWAPGTARFHVGCAEEWVCKKPAELQGYLHNPWPSKFSLPQGTCRGRMN